MCSIRSIDTSIGTVVDINKRRINGVFGKNVGQPRDIVT